MRKGSIFTLDEMAIVFVFAFPIEAIKWDNKVPLNEIRKCHEGQWPYRVLMNHSPLH